MRPIILAALFLSAPIALAHGPGSDWIWENPETSWCCYMNKDCQPIDEDDVVEIEPGVWQVKSTGQVFRQGERGTYPSKEMRPWACRTTASAPSSWPAARRSRRRWTTSRDVRKKRARA